MKWCITIVVTLALLLLIGCGESEIEPNQIFFNTPEVVSEMVISPRGRDFHLSVSEEQVRTIFPTLEMVEHEHAWGAAYYLIDGTLTDVYAHIYQEDLDHRITINIGFDRASSISLHEYLFAENTVYRYSDVYDVSVKAIMADNSWSESWKSFDARFKIGNVYFRVRFRDDEVVGKNRMNEIVRSLILGGSDGFAILKDPELPEIHSEELTFYEAFLDENFGAFVPTHIPNGLIFLHGGRYVRSYRDDDFMRLVWEKPYEEAYLYDIYNRWVSERTSDSPVFPFDEVFLGTNEMSWRISKVRDYELERLATIEDFENWFMPIFLAEELTFDIVRRIERKSEFGPQGSYWDENGDEADIFIPLEIGRIGFDVLFGEILVSINATTGNISVEDIWQMLESLMD